jgi:hypothetical protein
MHDGTAEVRQIIRSLDDPVATDVHGTSPFCAASDPRPDLRVKYKNVGITMQDVFELHHMDLPLAS